MVIKKVGNKYCVFSKDGTKNLGCSDTLEGAKKRLKQVEYFKHTKGTKMSGYKDIFENMGKAAAEGFEVADAVQENQPESLKVGSEHTSVEDSLRKGTIANRPSDRLLDAKDHFPAITQTQAQSSMARVMQLNEVPNWYSGTLNDLRLEVYHGIASIHEDIDLNVKVSAEEVLALSDGHKESALKTSDIKDPVTECDHKTPSIKNADRPTITSADLKAICEDEGDRKVVAGEIMNMIEQKVKMANEAKKLAQKLMKGGISGDDYESLSTFLQEDILREMMFKEKSSNAARKQQLLKKMKKKKEDEDDE